MDSWVWVATIWFVVWLICLWLVWRMVDRKDLNRALWIVLCIFFPVIVLDRRGPAAGEAAPGAARDDAVGLRLRLAGRALR